MNEENLTASWDLLSQLSDNLKEYVVQYRQAGCPPGQGFDWVKVSKNQTTGTFKGLFDLDTFIAILEVIRKDYTAKSQL